MSEKNKKNKKKQTKIKGLSYLLDKWNYLFGHPNI